MRVLLVDDDHDLRAVVRRALEAEGVQVLEADDATSARNVLSGRQLDVVLLDLHLPGAPGSALLREVRATDGGVHVIMVSGDAAEDIRVRAFADGADDFVTKPFSLRELVARVLAVRRTAVRQEAAITVGDLSIDPVARSVTLRGAPLDLRKLEFDLLWHFMSHPDTTFTRNELLAAVWSSSAEWQHEATVTEHIRRLRTRIEREPSRPEHLVTVWGVGYRFETGPPAGRLKPSSVLGSREAIIVFVGTTARAATASAAALLGAQHVAEIIGRDAFDFVAERSRAVAAARLTEVTDGNTPRPEVLTVKRVDGTELDVHLASTPVNWDGERASQVTVWPMDAETAPDG